MFISVCHPPLTMQGLYSVCIEFGGVLGYPLCPPKKMSFPPDDSPAFLSVPFRPVSLCPHSCLAWSPHSVSTILTLHACPFASFFLWGFGARILLCPSSLPLEQASQAPAFPEGPSAPCQILGDTSR